jgi:uncharacterized protein (DUF342 family)
MATSKAAASGGQQSIEQLQDRYQRLNERKIRDKANLENAEKQLDALRKEAREKYGTDDLEQLRQKLETMKHENETKRAGYQAELDRIESELAAVDQQFSAAENPSQRPAS